MLLLYAILTLLILYIFFKSIKKSGEFNLPPGPKGIPILGNALEINERNICDKLYQYSDKYGDIFSIKLLNLNIICLNSEGIIRKVLCTDPYRQYTNDRAEFFYSEYMYYGSQSIVFYKDANSTVHRGLRKGVIKALHFYGQEGVNEFEQKILSELNRLNRKIESFGNKEFDVLALIQRSLTNVISVLLSGEIVPDDDKDVNMFWEYVDGFSYFLNPTVNAILSAFPIFRYAPGFRYHFKRMSDSKDKLINRFFTKGKTIKRDGPKCLVDSLLEEQMMSIKEGREVIFTDERIKCVILETVVAGIVTTWSVLTSTILCLVNHPEYQETLFKEIEEHIRRDRQPTLADKINCPNLEALELEVHRLITVVPTFAGRICTRDITLEGYKIPKGTMIMANTWRVHHDSKVWGDPWNFRPERFLDVGGKLLPRENIVWKNWMPFAVGRRQCLGEQFARSRYFLYMASLLGKWKFVGSPGKFGPCDARNLENFDTTLTIRSKPFFCTAEKRY